MDLPVKANGKECRFQNTRKSEAMVPGTRQRGIFRAIKKQSKAYDVYLGRDSDGFAIFTATPQVAVPAA